MKVSLGFRVTAALWIHKYLLCLFAVFYAKTRSAACIGGLEPRVTVRAFTTLHLLSAALFTVLLAVSQSALAFSPVGHDAIEAIAYRELLEAHAIAGSKVEGLDVLRHLIRAGYLHRPKCFDDLAGSCSLDSPNRNRIAPEWWPTLGSGAADLVSSRQLGENGQCFHFMAEGRDFFNSPSIIGSDVPSGASSDAPHRCIRFLRSTFLELLANPRAADEEFRGVYALLHSIADSFSAAHAERDQEDRIVFLKPWKLRVWLPYLWHPAAFKYFNHNTHHDVVDSRDSGYLDSDSHCMEPRHGYELTRTCLSRRGDAAANALRDFLIALYWTDVTQCAGSGPCRPTSLSYFDAFVNVHFRLASGDGESGVLTAWEHEWRPKYSLGLETVGTFNAEPAVKGIWRVISFDSRMVPLVWGVHIAAGAYRRDGAWHPGVEMGTADLRLPLADSLTLSLNAASLELVYAPSSIRENVLVDGYSSAEVEFNISRNLVATTRLIRYGWSSGWQYQPTIGIAIQLDESRVPAPAVRSSASSGDAWFPPPMIDPDLRRHAFSIDSFYGLLANPFRNLVQADVVWDRDRWNRRIGIGAGVRAEAFEAVGNAGAATLGPLIAWHVVANSAFLSAAPIKAELYYEQVRPLLVQRYSFALGGSVSVGMQLNFLLIGVERHWEWLSHAVDVSMRGTYLKIGFAWGEFL